MKTTCSDVTGSNDNIFINFSNHPSSKWSATQTAEAEKFGKIVDIPFPDVDPAASKEDICKSAEKIVKKISDYHPAYVLCQGEFCLSYQVISLLKKKGVTVGASCSKRLVEERTIGDRIEKLSVFQFEQFREY